MNPKVALVFPGQGSQAVGMASGLLDHPLARQLLNVAKDSGVDLSTPLLTDDAEVLRSTNIAQPALLFVELVLTAMLSEASQAKQSAYEIVGTAGHSVGEYAGLVFAGAISPTTAMQLVIQRGLAMAAMSQGGMLALLGAEVDQVQQLCQQIEARNMGPFTIANHNAPGQIVISGSTAAINEAMRVASTQNIGKAMRLNVSGAFHSPLMQPAADQFAAILRQHQFAPAKMPVVSNVDAAAHIGAQQLQDLAGQQLLSPVLWMDSVNTLTNQLGAQTLVEVGPGRVLSGLTKRINPQVTTFNIATPEDCQTWLAGEA